MSVVLWSVMSCPPAVNALFLPWSLHVINNAHHWNLYSNFRICWLWAPTFCPKQKKSFTQLKVLSNLSKIITFFFPYTMSSIKCMSVWAHGRRNLKKKHLIQVQASMIDALGYGLNHFLQCFCSKKQEKHVFHHLRDVMIRAVPSTTANM